MKITEESRKNVGQGMTGKQYQQARLDARLTHHDLGISRATLWRIEQGEFVALRHVLALRALCEMRAPMTLQGKLARLGL